MIKDNCGSGSGCSAGVSTYVRNRYFYGKLLDVRHFEMEQTYFNAKRWLLNRLVIGYGVVCGLDVTPGEDGNSIKVTPGVAIDKWGREIVVPQLSAAVPLKADLEGSTDPGASLCDEDEGPCVHVAICYHECESDPVPALGGDCDETSLCSPGAIRERYEIVVRSGKLPDISVDCTVPDLISGCKINYPALARYISGPCPECPDDPCIGLANVRLPEQGSKLTAEHINIAVRPIVFNLDLLHDLLVCFCGKSANHEYRGGKN